MPNEVTHERLLAREGRGKAFVCLCREYNKLLPDLSPSRRTEVMQEMATEAYWLANFDHQTSVELLQRAESARDAAIKQAREFLDIAERMEGRLVELRAELVVTVQRLEELKPTAPAIVA